MLYGVVKILLSAGVIFAVSEIARRNGLVASIVASIPLVSVLAFVWIYLETKNTDKIAVMSSEIFWLVIPSLAFFLTLPILLRLKLPFFGALAVSAAVTVGAYFGMLRILALFGIK